MSNDLRKTLQLISDMRIMPLSQAGVLELIPEGDLTFLLHDQLDEYEFSKEDTVEDIFNKYFYIHDYIKQDEKDRIWSIIDKSRPTGSLGEAFTGFL